MIASGVAYIHGRGIVHCDLAARNVMVTNEVDPVLKIPVLKITDFGLARFADTPDVRITRVDALALASLTLSFLFVCAVYQLISAPL